MLARLADPPGKDRIKAANPEVSRQGKLHNSQIPKELLVSSAVTPAISGHFCSSFEDFAQTILIGQRKLAQFLYRVKLSSFLLEYIHLRCGWVYLERTRIFNGIQFTRHFIEFVVVETKPFVGSNVNMILTRQTCGQRSSMSAGSKRRALAFYFGVRFCNMFLISKCRGESDLGLCATLVLANRMLLLIGKF